MKFLLMLTVAGIAALSSPFPAAAAGANPAPNPQIPSRKHTPSYITDKKKVGAGAHTMLIGLGVVVATTATVILTLENGNPDSN